MQNNKAATYCRSSKDRSDISIEAQGTKLAELAASRQLAIVEAFQDVVESGKDEDRDGFQDLIRAIKNRRRGWSWLLIYDTSRLARNRYTAQWIKRDCERYGITIVFANLADIDPVTKIIVESIFEGFDEWHSAMSREKGLAGMRTNVRNGWRAGGRAPAGYRLAHEPTGAIREGKPVLKSKLVPTADAHKLGEYLRQRAQGVPRAKLIRDMTIPWTATTLVDIEWNALLYAGHTVWNRHREKKHRGSGGSRRRPRAEWQIQRNTHPALITDIQAEAILAQLETSRMSQAVSRAKSAVSSYLLTGLIQTTDRRMWVGAGDYYRLKASEGRVGRKIPREAFDQAVLATITSDMRSDDFVKALTDAAKASSMATDPAAPMRAEIAKLTREKQRAAQLALTVDDAGTFTKLVEERARQIQAIEREIAAVAADESISEILRTLTPARVRELLFEAGSATAILHSFVDRIVIDPATGPEMPFQIMYRAYKSGVYGWRPHGDSADGHLAVSAVFHVAA